tara:strand:- start:375 stop:1382 length:1008 start_codon:yes stop_codon:yes gene_type:complete
MFNNKNILITGGTGSFGKAFAKKILTNYKPKKLIIFSRDELKQNEMSLDPFFSNKKNIRYFIGDVRDYQRLKVALREVDFVVHAAALKQVPAAEYNPEECIKTNIYGAENIVNASIECGVEKTIALSTDKAVNPINLYGASKLASDKLFQAAKNLSGNQKSSFSVVRYGNVVGSRGSVLPFFSKMVKEKAKYLPITHEDMTRFWITLDEGVNFVINSFKMMKGGEIFVPKMPSIKIVDLAKSLSSKIKLKKIGIRPGEKLHEILIPSDLSTQTFEYKNIYIILPSFSIDNENLIYTYYKKISKLVNYGFEYNSKNNVHYLDINEIKKLNKRYINI